MCFPTLYLQGEIARLQQELKKTKNSVYQRASSVKSNVTGKSWGKSQGDEVAQTQNKTGVQLLSVSNFQRI